MSTTSTIAPAAAPKSDALITVQRVEHLYFARATSVLDSLNLQMLLDELVALMRDRPSLYLVLNLRRANLPQSSSWRRILDLAASLDGRLALCCLPAGARELIAGAGLADNVKIWTGEPKALSQWFEAKPAAPRESVMPPRSEEPPPPPDIGDAPVKSEPDERPSEPIAAHNSPPAAAAAVVVSSQSDPSRPTRYHSDAVPTESVLQPRVRFGARFWKQLAVLGSLAAVAATVWLVIQSKPGNREALEECRRFYSEFQQLRAADQLDRQCGKLRDRIDARLSPVLRRLASRGGSRSGEESELMSAIRCLLELTEDCGGETHSDCETRLQEHLKRAEDVR